jgi:hypothetical protein
VRNGRQAGGLSVEALRQLEGSRQLERTLTRKQKNSHCWSHYQAITGEGTAGWKRLSLCSSDLLSVEISDGAVIKCNYESCVNVVNKPNIQSETPSRVTHTRDNIKYIKNKGNIEIRNTYNSFAG